MLNIGIKVDDTTTPALAEVRRVLTDLTELNKMIATNGEVLTRDHILFKAAPARHKTATELGATPTGYLTRRGSAIESEGTREFAIITLGGEREIFARVDGPVVIRPVTKQWLTLPAIAAAYGRRAREFSTLKFIPLRSTLAALAEIIEGTKQGKRGKPVKDYKLKVFYWLHKETKLSQDRGLLPTEEQYTAAGEMAAQDMIDDLLKEETTA